MNDHKEKEHLIEIAQAAAALHGQEWRTLPIHARDRWIETVRNMNRGGNGVNDMERHAGQAIDEWYKAKEAQPAVERETAAASEKKTRTKK